MRDKENHSPVLFLEEVYPHFTNTKYEQAIEYFAMLRAWQLGLPLVNKLSTASTNIYPNPIEVVAVKVSEYVDAVGTEQTSGYTIEGATVLFSPKVSRKQLPKLICDAGLAMGKPSLGPRPLNGLQDLTYMYRNIRAKTGITVPEFCRKINLQLTLN